MIRLGPGSYFGQTVSANRAGRFAITATKYEAGQILPKHYHAQPYLFVMLRGGLGEVERQREHVCTRGWLVYNEAGESHHDVVLEGGARRAQHRTADRWLSRVSTMPRGKHEPIIYRHAGPALTAIGALEFALRADLSIRDVAVEEAVTRACRFAAARAQTLAARRRAGSIAPNRTSGNISAIRCVSARSPAKPAYTPLTSAANFAGGSAAR